VTHPKRKVKAIWEIQQTPASLPYQPSLSSQPDGWELALSVTFSPKRLRKITLRGKKESRPRQELFGIR
jgi:hypothetical protein